MRIQHNIMAMNAYRNYNTNTSALSKNLEKLSSGYKINRAGDDAAGLAISEKMRAQITGLNAAQKNVKDGISLVKTAEGAMQEIQDMLNRMDYLATQSANGTYDDPVDRLNLQKEVNQLRSEINRIADSANFNGIKLLDGSLATANENAWNVQSEISAGADTAPTWTEEDISGKFGTTTAGDAWHPGAGNGPQATVTFKIDLAGMKGSATAAAAAGTANFQLNVAGTDLDLSVTVAAGTAGDPVDISADDLAAALNGKEFSIQGISMTASVTGSEVTFEMSSGETYTSAEAANFNANWSKGIELKAGTTSAGKVDSASATRHTAYDEVMAKAADSGSRAGIDLDLDGLVTDYSKLTIKGTAENGSQDVTFIFKTDANSAATADATKNEILIDVSDPAFATDADKVAEALRQMTDSTINDKLNDPDAADKEVYLSAHNGKLHLDQTTTSNKVYADPASMQNLVTFNRAAGTAPVPGGVSVDLNKFQLGDRVKVGDKTYVVSAKTDASAKELTAEDLAAELKNKLMEGVDTSKYEAAVDGTRITISAITRGDGDSTADLTALKTTIDTNITTLKEDNAAGGGLTLQIGDTSDDFNQLKVNVGNMHVFAMGTFATENVNGKDVQVLQTSIDDIDISDVKGAQDAIDVIKNAINYVSGVRGDLGATQNRLEHTANNLSVMAENIQDAESTIRDTDIAEEMMSYTKNNILVQSAQAMLAQANAVPQGVLQLLG